MRPMFLGECCSDDSFDVVDGKGDEEEDLDAGDCSVGNEERVGGEKIVLRSCRFDDDCCNQDGDSYGRDGPYSERNHLKM